MVEKGEKIVLPKKGQETKTASEIPKKKAEPPLKMVQSQVPVKPLSPPPPEESNPVPPIDNLSPMKPSGPSEKISVAHDISPPSPPVKVEARIAEIKPTPRMATDEEVKRFFADYVERYNQKDIQGFISFFSSKAIQNQKDGLEGIRRIYENFFNQSQGLEYRIENIKIEVVQNSIQVRARYEIDQVLNKEEGRKIWRGHIQWILVKEEGVFKITSLNYQNDQSP
jgi:ketosteroid isomerase-like protein